MPSILRRLRTTSLNALLTTIRNQGDEIEMKDAEITRLKARLEKYEPAADEKPAAKKAPKKAAAKKAPAKKAASKKAAAEAAQPAAEEENN